MTTNSGKKAEDVACEYLTEHGYKIIDKNWRTRLCEIDIVAQKNNRIYFVEVKYRKSDHYGGGLDYITSTKVKQIKKAAEIWISSSNWNKEYLLSAIEVSGESFVVTGFIEEIL
jgi:uncharacterized protein (TIGR00252 family)